MNKQVIYNQVRKHLLTQMKPARDLNYDNCKYRTDDGLMCGIGCLMNEEELKYFTNEDSSINLIYHEGINGGDELSKKLMDRLECNNTVDLKFLIELQNLHDQTEPESWAAKLDLLALENQLEVQES